MRANNKTLLFPLMIAFVCAGTPVSAQQSNKENSPYNRFGIGTLSDNNQNNVRGEAGAATAYSDPFSVNAFNPATYSFLKLTTLEFGIEARSRNILMNDEAVKSSTATFSYFYLGIPLKKYAGLNFGYQPISSMYYKQSDTSIIDGLGNTAHSYNGNGNLQYAFIGLSGQYKGFSIGANVGYAFGNMSKASSLEYVDTLPNEFIRNATFLNIASVGGIYWKGGALYQADLNKEQYLNIGATATFSQSLKIKRDRYDIASTYFQDATTLTVDSAIDTTASVVGEKGTLVMPSEYSFGVHYGKWAHWDVGIDFKYNDWSKFRNFGVKDSVANNAWRLAAGGEVTPNPESRKNYLSQITYRLGFYYGNDYFYLRNTQLNYWGASLGMSFPFMKERLSTQYAKINTALDIGRRGTTQNGLAREFFVKFSVGIALNDIWFTKRKYD